MKLEVVTPEDYLGNITADLSSRRALIDKTFTRGKLMVIEARAPLEKMFGYSTAVRSLSQGRASYTMEPLEYARPDSLLESLLESISRRSRDDRSGGSRGPSRGSARLVNRPRYECQVATIDPSPPSDGGIDPHAIGRGRVASRRSTLEVPVTRTPGARSTATGEGRSQSIPGVSRTSIEVTPVPRCVDDSGDPAGDQVGRFRHGTLVSLGSNRRPNATGRNWHPAWPRCIRLSGVRWTA